MGKKTAVGPQGNEQRCCCGRQPLALKALTAVLCKSMVARSGRNVGFLAGPSASRLRRLWARDTVFLTVTAPEGGEFLPKFQTKVEKADREGASMGKQKVCLRLGLLSWWAERKSRSASPCEGWAAPKRAREAVLKTVDCAGGGRVFAIFSERAS